MGKSIYTLYIKYFCNTPQMEISLFFLFLQHLMLRLSLARIFMLHREEYKLKFRVYFQWDMLDKIFILSSTIEISVVIYNFPFVELCQSIRRKGRRWGGGRGRKRR